MTDLVPGSAGHVDLVGVLFAQTDEAALLIDPAEAEHDRHRLKEPVVVAADFIGDTRTERDIAIGRGIDHPFGAQFELALFAEDADAADDVCFHDWSHDPAVEEEFDAGSFEQVVIDQVEQLPILIAAFERLQHLGHDRGGDTAHERIHDAGDASPADPAPAFDQQGAGTFAGGGQRRTNASRTSAGHEDVNRTKSVRGRGGLHELKLGQYECCCVSNPLRKIRRNVRNRIAVRRQILLGSGMLPEAPRESLLARLLEIMQATGPLRMNLEDYLGIFADVPGLEIPQRFFGHAGAFCQFAKRHGFADCFANKRAVNRLLQRGQCGFAGACHLGLTDLVEPVMVDGICVAGVFYGSILIEGDEHMARSRIARYCKRRGMEEQGYLERLADVPRVSRDELPRYRAQLQLVADLLARLVKDSAIPLAPYHQERDAQSVRARAGYPAALQVAMRTIDQAYAQPLTRAEVARRAHCNANYLSSLFTSHLGIGFRDYLNRVRLERAKRLLRNTTQTIGEIAFGTGFEDQSYFNRRFRAATGMTPGEWRKAARPRI